MDYRPQYKTGKDNPASPTLQGHHLERVECFKYLGLLLTFLILYAVRQGNCWDYCTENTTNMQSRRSYSNYMYPWYVLT